MPETIIVVTEDPRRWTAPRLLKALDKAAPLAPAAEDEAPPYFLHPDGIQIPARGAIDPPAEFAGNVEFEERWNLALHEAGHAVMAQLQGGCNGIGIQRMTGTWQGVAFDACAEGEPRYSIALAGCAAEALGASPAYLPFGCSDFEFTRDELRARGVPEAEIPDQIGRDLAQMADELAARWTKAVRALALAVCERGWLSGDQVRDMMGTAQEMLTKAQADPFGTVRKWEDSRAIGVQPLAKAASEFDRLATEVAAIGADHEHQEAKQRLDQAMTSRAGAVEVAKLENAAHRTGERAQHLAKEAGRAA